MTIQHLYTLLVGINDYPVIRPLKGCINDIEGWATYLKSHYNQYEQLHLKILKNEEATRDAVIDGFRTHLRKANAGDGVLFIFCGHGSQQAAPMEFWNIEPDHMNETLVCWDSRLEGISDLADKELGQLISEVAQTEPQITVILDCCHAGSGSRLDISEDNTRYIETDYRRRLADSYLVALPATHSSAVTRDVNVSLLSKFEWPNGPHILLAACQPNETAKECKVNGQSHGIFSYLLLDTLRKTNNALTYRDLFKQVEALVKSFIPVDSPQSPQLESIYGCSYDRYFLGDVIADHPPS